MPCGESGTYEACGQRPSPSICPPSGLWTATATHWKRPHPRLSGLTGKQGPVPPPIRLCLAGGLCPDSAGLGHQGARAPSPAQAGWGRCRWLQVSGRLASQESRRGGEEQVLRGHSGRFWAFGVAGAAPAQGGVDGAGIPGVRSCLPLVTGSSFPLYLHCGWPAS